MKTYLFLAVTIFVTLTTTWAKAEVGCYQDLLVSTSYIEPNPRQKICLLAKEEFAKAISVLCTEDQSKLSNNYLKYLYFNEALEKTLNAYQDATNKAERDLAFKNITSIQNEIKNAGFEDTIRSARSSYSNAIESCLSR